MRSTALDWRSAGGAHFGCALRSAIFSCAKICEVAASEHRTAREAHFGNSVTYCLGGWGTTAPVRILGFILV